MIGRLALVAALAVTLAGCAGGRSHADSPGVAIQTTTGGASRIVDAEQIPDGAEIVVHGHVVFAPNTADAPFGWQLRMTVVGPDGVALARRSVRLHPIEPIRASWPAKPSAWFVATAGERTYRRER